jgi:hypothetical protein
VLKLTVHLATTVFYRIKNVHLKNKKTNWIFQKADTSEPKLLWAAMKHEFVKKKT